MAETNRSKVRMQWRIHKLIWKLSGGRLGRKVSGRPVLELVTTGHKSGQPRQILITYVDSEGSPAILGTNAGRSIDPAWVKNLRANPAARARWDGRWREVAGSELSGAEHVAAWAIAVATNPGYADYRQDLARPVPIIRLVEQ